MPMSAREWIAGGQRFARPDGRGIFYRSDGEGPVLVMLHGFPTWSYDYAELVPFFSTDHRVLTLDFLGYGASDKPRDAAFSVSASADTVEALLRHLGVERARLVIHDYGAIVGQELLDRRRRGQLGFTVDGVTLMNSGVVYAAYRPAFIQRLLANHLTGALVARLVSRAKVHKGLNAVRSPKHPLSDAAFAELWHGIDLQHGTRIAHRLVRYNHERAVHADRWLAALVAYDGPLHLVWGNADPVSGRHVLQALTPLLPHARVDAFDGLGHFPMAEAPAEVASAMRAAASAVRD